MAVRYLGLILPFAVTYWLAPGLGSRLESDGWRLAMVSLGAAIWIAATVTLIVRRDWKGAAAITVFYALVDAWWWIVALGVIRFD
jgi:hypothetical protein